MNSSLNYSVKTCYFGYEFEDKDDKKHYEKCKTRFRNTKVSGKNRKFKDRYQGETYIVSRLLLLKNYEPGIFKVQVRK